MLLLTAFLGCTAPPVHPVVVTVALWGPLGELAPTSSETALASIARSNVLADSGVYAASLAREYCLVWEAGAAGALVDYRLRLRPAAR